MGQDQAVYTIGAVVRSTGISASTLRVWERRYGFPQPVRSQGGHRHYTEREVAGLRWIASQVDRGVRTGQAIRAYRQRGTAVPSRDPAQAQAQVSPAHPQSPDSQDAHMDALQRRILASLLGNDLAQADEIFLKELSRYPVEIQAFRAILPTLQALGDAWESGGATVSTEHLATQYLRHRLALWSLTASPLYAVPPTVLACAPGELHEGGLLILSALLQHHRWPVAYLGQSVPLDDLGAFVEDVKPLAVVLSATREETARSLAAGLPALLGAARSGRPQVCYGGAIFVAQPAWRERVPGSYLGDDLQKGLDTLERMLRDAAASLA